MKIFIAGENKPHSYETFCAEEFRRAGCEVLHWSNRTLTPLSPLKRLPGELRRLGGEVYNMERSLSFIHAMKAFQPDLLFMPKAENIHSRAVKIALAETKARLAIWYPDNPFWAPQTTMNVIRNLRVCDIYYSWGKFLMETLRSAGCRRVEYLPFAFYPDFFPTDVEISEADRKRLLCDICFVGTWDPDREKDLLPLAEFDLGIWGPLWKEKVAPSSPLYSKIRGGGLYGADMVKAYRCAKLVFNQLRFHNGDSHNFRTMEISGIGAAQLVRWTSEQSDGLFKNGVHLICFRDNQNLIDQVRELRERGFPDTQGMGQRAHEHVLKNHLLKYRIEKILKSTQAL